MKATDEFMQAAHRIRTLAAREIDRVARDSGLERDEKVSAVRTAIERAAAELDMVAADASSPDAESARRAVLEAAAFGMPAETAAAFASVGDNPDEAILAMSTAARQGDPMLASGIAAEAWLRALAGRRAWVKVVSLYGDLAVQPQAVRSLLASLNPRDYQTELAAFVPAWPANLSEQPMTVMGV